MVGRPLGRPFFLRSQVHPQVVTTGDVTSLTLFKMRTACSRRSSNLEGSTQLQSGTSCRPVMMHCPHLSNWLLTNRPWRYRPINLHCPTSPHRGNQRNRQEWFRCSIYVARIGAKPDLELLLVGRKSGDQSLCAITGFSDHFIDF